MNILKKFKSIIDDNVEKGKQERFFIIASTGPFVLGWIFGIQAFQPNDKRFAISLQNLFIFLGYCLLLLILYSFHVIFHFSIYALYYGHSFFALMYIAANIYILVNLIKKGRAIIHPWIFVLLDKLNFNSTQEK